MTASRGTPSEYQGVESFPVSRYGVLKVRALPQGGAGDVHDQVMLAAIMS